MTTFGGLLIGLMILSAIFILVYMMFNQYKKGRMDMLDEMFTNDDIPADKYKKYKKNED